MLFYNLLDISFRIDGVNADEVLKVIFIVLGLLLVMSIIIWVAIKNKDNNKPLLTRDCKIIEKSSNGGVDRYTVEFDNGERMVLINYNTANTRNIFLTAGDIGVIGYQGDTIKSFTRGNQINNSKPSKPSGFRKNSSGFNFDDFQKNKEENLNEKTNVNNGEWQCANCGKTHQSYVGTCGCGERKPR